MEELLMLYVVGFKILRWYRHCANARKREVEYTEEKAALYVIKGCAGNKQFVFLLLSNALPFSHVIGYLRRGRRRAKARISVAGRLGRRGDL
jgi:hypothetical protein